MRQAALIALVAASLIACDGSAPDDPILAGVIGDRLPTALAQAPGNPSTGAEVFVDRDQGHCVLCHQLSGLDAPFQGNLGPRLDGVGARLSVDQLRLRIAAPQLVWPGTIMPAYARRLGLHQVDPKYDGEPILSGQQIEDLVVFLAEQDQTVQALNE
ncbi:MAG: sulfur oxidation c-type cytochrome SoxX [Pseudomonadota bacterium]